MMIHVGIQICCQIVVKENFCCQIAKYFYSLSTVLLLPESYHQESKH